MIAANQVPDRSINQTAGFTFRDGANRTFTLGAIQGLPLQRLEVEDHVSDSD